MKILSKKPVKTLPRTLVKVSPKTLKLYKTLFSSNALKLSFFFQRAFSLIKYLKRKSVISFMIALKTWRLTMSGEL